MKGARTGYWRLAIAALVISFVATRVPWADRVQASGAEEWVEGELIGTWRSEAVSFRMDEGQVLPEGWDGGWALALRHGEPADLVRSVGVVWEPGLWTVLGGLRFGAFFGVLAGVLGGVLCGVTRWWRLLMACGVPTAYGRVARLTLLGMFWNLIVPGMTGGDVVKAGLAAKEHPEQRSAAVMAVALDRIIGLWTLLWIATGASWLLREELRVLVLPLLCVSVLGSVAMLVLGWPRLRDGLGAQRFLRRLPVRLDGTVAALRSIAAEPFEVLGAVLLSAGNHACVAFAVYSVAHGMGDETAYLGCLAASVVASAVSAVPLAPGGWGVGEAAYAAMFGLLGAGEAVGYAVSVSYRLCQTGVSLLCGLALWRGSGGVEWSSAGKAVELRE